MRNAEETRKRWNSYITKTTTSPDLKAGLKSSENFNPCEDGLRSVCWKAFLLFDGLSQSQWPKALSDSRGAYTSLREHFLKYIEFPDEIESTVDPLNEDENSPWQSLRHDESIRAEIFQDVERCLQDNCFFREPSTQKTLLDILFVYSKLNPDIGYRQGMHEILAPVLWVVERDAIKDTDRESADDGRGMDLMCEMLHSRYIEHDAFSLFCVIMQTVKSFYEVGDHNQAPNSQDTSPIVIRSRRIHHNLLGVVDPQLANHLQAVEILPQIFVIRWIRLLFGREFSFDDVLSVWDMLFAERLNLNLVDLICVSMLLRIRWELMDADYSSALTLLLRYPEPKASQGPSTFVDDALYLQANLTRGAGSLLISKYTGKSPVIKHGEQPHITKDSPIKERPTSNRTRQSRSSKDHSSPGGSPARFLQQQRGLEGLFQDVSGGLQRRSEAWGIAKTVRGAVSDVKRNVQGLQSGSSSPRASAEIAREPSSQIIAHAAPSVAELTSRIKVLEDRNKALATMLGNALEALRSADEGPDTKIGSEKLTEGVARIQFVQVYLEDPSISLPSDDREEQQEKALEVKVAEEETVSIKPPSPKLVVTTPVVTLTPTPSIQKRDIPTKSAHVEDSGASLQPSPFQHSRPALAQSSFSWMLGDDRRQSSFVTSSLLAPDERRNGDTQPHLFGDNKGKGKGKGEEGKKSVESDDDGFTMDSLRGGQG